VETARIEHRIAAAIVRPEHEVVVLKLINRRRTKLTARLRACCRRSSTVRGIVRSDDVTGRIESGVDFEKRINDIYQRCAAGGDPVLAFDDLQKY